MFETFSYLPPLSDDQIARQVDYIVNNGYTPCLEFSMPEDAYVSSANSIRFGPVSCVSASQRLIQYLEVIRCPIPSSAAPMLAYISSTVPRNCQHSSLLSSAPMLPACFR
jgi:ribulose-bisphosphate carboxylase small chain